MRVAFDTSSFRQLVRYYLPFDTGQRLHRFIQERVEAKEILVIEEVFLECRSVAHGAVINALPYLGETKNRVKTGELLPTKRLFNRIENDFAITVLKNKLTEAEFERVKQDYIASADLKLILLALREQEGIDGTIAIVTEETATSNDGKPFKKIPAICELHGIGIRCIDLPTYLREADGIDFRVT